MKFGKLLKHACEDMPDIIPHNLFLRYKELKKHLKAIKKGQQEHGDGGASDELCSSTPCAGEGAPSGAERATSNASSTSGRGCVLSAEEAAFVATLNEDLAKFNAFFIENEEDSVIKLQVLSDEVAAAAAAVQPPELRQLSELKARLVDFHGDLVLLLHWSLLNYAAVAKILKKHDKGSGLLLRAPFLTNVLQQPFYSTSIMSRLATKAEQHINSVAALQQEQGEQQQQQQRRCQHLQEEQEQQQGKQKAQPPHPPSTPDQAGVDSSSAGSSSKPQGPGAGGGLLRRTQVALDTWQQLTSTAVTPSTLLPPGSAELMQHLQARERWLRAAQQQCHAPAPSAEGAAPVQPVQPPAVGAAGQRPRGTGALAADEAGGGSHKRAHDGGLDAQPAAAAARQRLGS